MPRIVKVKIGSDEYNAIEQDFEISKEDWNEYKLLDGGVVRLRTTAQKILQIIDENGKPMYTADGDRFLYVRHNTQVVASE